MGLDYYSEFQNYAIKHMGMEWNGILPMGAITKHNLLKRKCSVKFNTLYLRRKRIKGNANGFFHV
jgi:hypothetical protein